MNKIISSIVLFIIYINICCAQAPDVIWLKPTLLGYEYVQAGKTQKIGFLGKNLKTTIGGFEIPRNEMDKYSKLSAWSEGLTLLWTGSVVLAIYEADKGRKNEMLCFSLSGSAIGIVLVALHLKSQQCLHKAVGHYNQEIVKLGKDSRR